MGLHIKRTCKSTVTALQLKNITEAKERFNSPDNDTSFRGKVGITASEANLTDFEKKERSFLARF